MPKVQAAGTLTISFSKEELALLSDIEAWAEVCGGKSQATKMILSAGLGDKEAQAKMDALRAAVEVFRKQRSFTGAARLVARELAPAVAAG